MAEPTQYDLEQDARIETVESLVTAEYQPPAGTEYSYPVASQGITQEQFRTMMRAAGSGTFVQHDDTEAQVSYRLSGHGSDSETNQRNTLILRPAPTTGRAETAYHGFFHVLTEDMELPFPAVTSGTTYHVCVTYDPRLFKTTPLKIEVYPGTPPTTSGRDSIVLFKVRREPNQLLSQATITKVNPWLGHVINVWTHDHLPEPTSVEYGTLAVVINPGMSRGKALYTNRGIHGWEPLLHHPWVERTPANGWTRYDSDHAPLRLQRVGNRVYLSGFLRKGNSRQVFQTSQALAPRYDQEFTVNTGPVAGGHTRTGRITVRSNNWVELVNGFSEASWIQLDGISYVLD